MIQISDDVYSLLIKCAATIRAEHRARTGGTCTCAICEGLRRLKDEKVSKETLS